MPLWATIDLMDSHLTPIASLPWLPRAHGPNTIGPCLAHSLRLWDLVKYSAGLISPHLRLLHCPLFPQGRDNPQQFSCWTENGFTDLRLVHPYQDSFICSPTFLTRYPPPGALQLPTALTLSPTSNKVLSHPLYFNPF